VGTFPVGGLPLVTVASCTFVLQLSLRWVDTLSPIKVLQGIKSMSQLAPVSIIFKLLFISQIDYILSYTPYGPLQEGVPGGPRGRWEGV